MTLADWEVKGWLQQHRASEQEVLDLLYEAESDLNDARRDLLLVTWQFGLACTAALNLCTLLLHASGYRTETQSHRKAIFAMPLILGAERKADADYLDSCLELREQQNTQSLKSLTPLQVEELTLFTENLYTQVLIWLNNRGVAVVVNGDNSLSKGSDWVLSLLEA